MNDMIKAVEGEAKREEPRTIYKVLETIRQEDPLAYDPKIISIGPFHHGKEALQPMEKFKGRFIHDLINSHPENSVEKYIKVVKSLEAEARNCYSESDTESNDFVKMVVLDGCFIIEFLLKFFQGNCKGQLYSVNWNMPLLRNDLLLLENQIPFLVHECLFSSTIIPRLTINLEEEKDDEEECSINLTDLAVSYISYVAKYEDSPIPDDVHLLLHLFHSSLHPSPVPQAKSNKSLCGCFMNKIKRIVSYSFSWMMSLLLSWWWPPPHEPSQQAPRMTPSEPSQKAPRMIPSATELHEAGVKFEIKKNAGCFLDVTFRVRDGTMEIPLLSIQAVTISQFGNLVAFEQCSPSAGSHFTSYVALMDNLIDTPEDVALLERNGVLENKLGGNEEVAHFFNSLGKGAYLDYENHYLVGLFKDVKEYCGTERHRWRARMVHDYFSNPWSIFSLIAAFVLLVLTITQTFSVFAYFRPP